MTSHPISHLVWCVTPHYATGAAVHKCVKASTQPDLSTRSKMSSHSLQSTACLGFWIACMWLRVKVASHWQVRLCFKLDKAFCDRKSQCPAMWHFKVTMETLQVKLKFMQTSQDSPTWGRKTDPLEDPPSSLPLKHVTVHAWKLYRAQKEQTHIREEMGANQRSPSAHAIHRTSRPQCEVLLSRTWPPIQIPG